MMCTDTVNVWDSYFNYSCPLVYVLTFLVSFQRKRESGRKESGGRERREEKEREFCG